MAKLCKMVVADPETKNLTKEQKEAYITALEEHHERKVVGVWAHNLAAVQDIVATMDRIVKKVGLNLAGNQVNLYFSLKLDDLQVQTGIYGTLFVVCSHINNTIQSAMKGEAQLQG
jgi:hypothetical protein